jgi:hypothetical protein
VSNNQHTCKIYKLFKRRDMYLFMISGVGVDTSINKGTQLLNGVFINIARIVSLVQWAGYTGCFLLGPGTLILVISFMICSPGEEAKVYCRDLEWYPDTTARSDGCKMNIAVDTTCNNDKIGGVHVPTISKTIEYWPYATALVMGTAVLNIFTAVVFDSIYHNDKYVPIIWYISAISMWAVFGTSSYGDNLCLYYAHVIATSLLFITTILYTIVIMYYRRLIGKWVPITLLSICLITTIICIVCSLLYSVFPAHGYAEHQIDQVLAISELVYIFSYSMLLAYIITVSCSMMKEGEVDGSAYNSMQPPCNKTLHCTCNTNMSRQKGSCSIHQRPPVRVVQPMAGASYMPLICCDNYLANVP